MDTETIKNTLKQLREELSNRKDALDRDIQHKEEPVEKDFAEQASQLENDEVLTALDEETAQKIREIDSALLRLDHGDYGTCTQCGAAIDEKRLAIIPYASLCISCAEDSAG